MISYYRHKQIRIKNDMRIVLPNKKFYYVLW